MHLTIAELAVAVDRTETYIRQHIHRKHLTVVKKGRRVYVDVDEAQRWAQERGIPLRLPSRTATAITPMQDRTARMTVLVWTDPDGHLRNLFTLVRYRRKDRMGPWWREPNEDWRTEELPGDLRLLSCDLSWQSCTPIIDQILASGCLHVENLEVQYDLCDVDADPRHHWAYRDMRPKPETSQVSSPFKSHSAEVHEYWSFAPEPQNYWCQALEQRLHQRQSHLWNLGFPLDRHSDRVGHLMIARAEDGFTCDLVAHHDQTLTLNVEADDHESLCGTVWASHSGDEILRQRIAITSGKKLFELASEVDSIGLAVFRTSDGQCVDLAKTLLSPGVSRVTVTAATSTNIYDQKGTRLHNVMLSSPPTTNTARAKDQTSSLDRRIRQKWVDHSLYMSEKSARERGDVVRFEPGDWQQAIGYIINALRSDVDLSSPSYFADPYFLKENAPLDLHKFLIEMSAATANTGLRILCGPEGTLPKWWPPSPLNATSDVRIRTFTEQDGSAAFHDRYLITPKREILISNSVNSWNSSEVVFAKLPFGVYRPVAERYWKMKVGCSTKNIRVEEL